MTEAAAVSTTRALKLPGLYVMPARDVSPIHWTDYTCEHHKHRLDLLKRHSSCFQFALTTFTGSVLKEHTPDCFKVVLHLRFD